MKIPLPCAVIAGILTTAAAVNAADITWQTPTTISGASDVSILGSLVGTWAPGDDAYNPDSLPVNGVTFNAYGSGPFNSLVGISGNDDHYTGYGSAGTADGNYNTILKAAIYSYGDTITMTWGGMTAGNSYLFQFWVNDARNNITAERSETLTGGANTSGALAFGTGAGGTGPGQYVVGTFVADGTGTQTLTISALGGADIGPSAQMNLMQLRDITPVPEPSTVAILSGGFGVLLWGLRRKNRKA